MCHKFRPVCHMSFTTKSVHTSSKKGIKRKPIDIAILDDIGMLVKLRDFLQEQGMDHSNIGSSFELFNLDNLNGNFM